MPAVNLDFSFSIIFEKYETVFFQNWNGFIIRVIDTTEYPLKCIQKLITNTLVKCFHTNTTTTTAADNSGNISSFCIYTYAFIKYYCRVFLLCVFGCFKCWQAPGAFSFGSSYSIYFFSSLHSISLHRLFRQHPNSLNFFYTVPFSTASHFEKDE